MEVVQKGDFGLALGRQAGGFSRIWFKEPISADEVVFDGQTYLLLPSVATALRADREQPAPPVTVPQEPEEGPAIVVTPPVAPSTGFRRIRLRGSIPPEIWNRVGNRLLPKLRSGARVDISLGFDVEVDAPDAGHLLAEIRQILADLALTENITIESDQ